MLVYRQDRQPRMLGMRQTITIVSGVVSEKHDDKK